MKFKKETNHNIFTAVIPKSYEHVETTIGTKNKSDKGFSLKHKYFFFE